MKFPFYHQTNKLDCGPTCLKMISAYYGKHYDNSIIKDLCNVGVNGTSFDDLSKAAEYIGFNTLVIKITSTHLTDELELPCIALWKQNHFIVIYKINNKFVYVADPSKGLKKYYKKDFLHNWIFEGEAGVLMYLEGIEKKTVQRLETVSRINIIKFLLSYLKPYKFLLFQLGLGLIIGSVVQLIFPITTQILVDIGIGSKNIGFIYMILLGQLALFLGQTAVNIIKSWILLHIGARLNMNIVYDFLNKLMTLNIKFFENRKLGDLIQRTFDSKRIENFLTNSLTLTLFSIINLIVFSIVLAVYSIKIFWIFFAGSIISAAWLILFLKKRREIDNHFFSSYSENYNKIFQLIAGIRDIKLNSSENKKINEWEKVQIRLFNIQSKSLLYSQYQHTGTIFVTQLKNIIITIIAAQSVVNGEITLGMMMAITFISGQLNVPIEQMISFIQSGQDAEISAERLLEIKTQENEYSSIKQNKFVLRKNDIHLRNLNFKYDDRDNDYIIKNFNLKIERNKITAIVGSSGSGKTTLLKLLLKFYSPCTGSIFYDDLNLADIEPAKIRKLCGVVMQDSYIFSDTIAGNIALSSDEVDMKALDYAAKLSNIYEFIQSLPFKYHTKIGGDEKGISQGQKQRLLIARAVYKNPEFIFLDEATNALDTKNEGIVMNNLVHFFKNKTVVVVAHRLSTVMNADKIVVLENGEIAEYGNHNELVENKNRYYNLIRNQLELNHGN